MSHANQINEIESDDFDISSVSDSDSANEIASGKKDISAECDHLCILNRYNINSLQQALVHAK